MIRAATKLLEYLDELTDIVSKPGTKGANLMSVSSVDAGVQRSGLNRGVTMGAGALAGAVAVPVGVGTSLMAHNFLKGKPLNFAAAMKESRYIGYSAVGAMLGSAAGYAVGQSLDKQNPAKAAAFGAAIGAITGATATSIPTFAVGAGVMFRNLGRNIIGNPTPMSHGFGRVASTASRIGISIAAGAAVVGALTVGAAVAADHLVD